MEVSLVNTKYVPGQLRLDVYNKNKWEPGTELTWCFLEEPNKDDEEATKSAFESWSEICFIKFVKLNDGDLNALIRIGFDPKEAPWSVIGTDVLDKRFTNKKTMNLFCAKQYKPLYPIIALHQIGHILGFPHEHQTPNSGIIWNKGAVYEFFGQGWNKETIDHNVLNHHRGFPGFDFDPHSIMNCGFAPNLIKEPHQFSSGLPIPPGFSKQDQKLAQKFYPFPVTKSIPDQLSVGKSGGMLSVVLRKDETKIIRLQFNKSPPTQFHVSSLMSISNTTVEIELKNGNDTIASGKTNCIPLKGEINGTQICDWCVELKCPPSANEIPVTVIVF